MRTLQTMKTQSWTRGVLMLGLLLMQGFMFGSVAFANQDYFMFDPDSTNAALKNPKISFKIEDLGDPHQYKWEVKVRSTSSESREWTVFCRGQIPSLQQVTVTLNAPTAPNTQVGQLQYKGTYTFDIKVEEFDDLNAPNPQKMDEQTLKSPHLEVPATYRGIDAETNTEVDKPGHDFYNLWQGGDLKAKLDYYLKDSQNKNASKVQVDFMDADWLLKASRNDLPTTVGVPHLDHDLYTYQNDMLSGDYKAIITGEDSHAAQYREHQNKRMLAVNAYKPTVAIEFIDGRPYQYAGANWFAIWVKRKLLGNSSKRQMRTDLLAINNGSLPTVYEHVWDKVLRLTGWSPGTNAVLYPKQGTIWGASNGTFFNHENDPTYALQGDIGLNGNWQGSGVRFRRWSLGIDNSGGAPAGPFTTGRMVDPDNNGIYKTPSGISSRYPYGLGGVGALVVNGARISPGYEVMEGNTKVNSNDPKGEYSELSKEMARTIVAWSDDGQHCFIIMAQQESRANITSFYGWSWREAQDFVLEKLPRVIADYTKPKGKSASAGLQITIDSAALLDGGSHSSLVYVRTKKTKELTEDSPYADTWEGWMTKMKEISEHHSQAGWPSYPTLDDGGHRENRTVVEAFAIP